MGAAGSVSIDPGTLRKEYEAMAASSASDEELLNHMKKLIISSSKDEFITQGKAATKPEDAGGAGDRASTSEPRTRNRRPSIGEKKERSQRRGSNAGGASTGGDRPVSAPNETRETPKVRPRSSQEGRISGKPSKPSKSRRMSFVGQPAPPCTDGVDGMGSAASMDSKQAIEAHIDTWESVTQQPSCPLCNMVFSSEGKRDHHIKSFPGHVNHAVDPSSQSVTPAPQPEPASAQDSIVDSVTIYSGTKLFWRSRLNVELFMQQHQQGNVVQVLVFDTSTNRQLGQVWVSLDRVVARLDQDTLKREAAAAERAFFNLGIQGSPEAVAAEARRKAVVSFIVTRIQVEDITEEGAEPGAPKTYTVTLASMASDGEGGLVVDQPPEVNPAFCRAASKRASIHEVNEVITSLRQSLSDVSGSAQQAVASLQCAEGAMQKGRRGSAEVARRVSASGMVTSASSSAAITA